MVPADFQYLSNLYLFRCRYELLMLIYRTDVNAIFLTFKTFSATCHSSAIFLLQAGKAHFITRCISFDMCSSAFYIPCIIFILGFTTLSPIFYIAVIHLEYFLYNDFILFYY